MKTDRTKGKEASRWRLTAPAVLLAAGQSMFAQAQPTAYEMLVYEDTMQGRRLVSGALEKAFAADGLFQGRGFNRLNNRCVMLTLKKAWNEAGVVCDEAVKAAEVEPIPVPFTGFAAGRQPENSREMAMALTNRGVLRALTDDALGAHADFELAANLSPGLEAPRINLMILESKTLAVVPMTQAFD